MENHISLNEQAFTSFHHWYDLVVLELLSLDQATLDPNWIAERLDISVEEAAGAVARLASTGCFEVVNGGIQINLENSYFALPLPSVHLKKMHEIFLEKGLSALYQQTMAERNFESYVMSFNPQRLPEARARIQEFIASFNRDFGGDKATPDVYCLGMQFFNLTT